MGYLKRKRKEILDNYLIQENIGFTSYVREVFYKVMKSYAKCYHERKSNEMANPVCFCDWALKNAIQSVEGAGISWNYKGKSLTTKELYVEFIDKIENRNRYE